jgi:hypothetical protein
LLEVVGAANEAVEGVVAVIDLPLFGPAGAGIDEELGGGEAVAMVRTV